MTSAVLRWLANGVIGAVVVGTLWMAQTVQSTSRDPSLLVAQGAAVPDDAASAPGARSR